MSQKVDPMDVSHTETTTRGAFRIGDFAEMTYTRPNPGTMRVNHTLVDKAHRGQGIAHQLYAAMVAFARHNQRQVVAVCPFVADTFERNPQDADVLAP